MSVDAYVHDGVCACAYVVVYFGMCIIVHQACLVRVFTHCCTIVFVVACPHPRLRMYSHMYTPAHTCALTYTCRHARKCTSTRPYPNVSFFRVRAEFRDKVGGIAGRLMAPAATLRRPWPQMSWPLTTPCAPISVRWAHASSELTRTCVTTQGPCCEWSLSYGPFPGIMCVCVFSRFLFDCAAFLCFVRGFDCLFATSAYPQVVQI